MTNQQRALQDSLGYLLDLAKHHAYNTPCEMQSSAQSTYTDACNIYGDYWLSKTWNAERQDALRFAAKRAFDSLAYSIGKFHRDYTGAESSYGHLTTLSRNATETAPIVNPRCTHNRTHPCEQCPHFFYNEDLGREVCHNEDE